MNNTFSLGRQTQTEKVTSAKMIMLHLVDSARGKTANVSHSCQANQISFEILLTKNIEKYIIISKHIY